MAGEKLARPRIAVTPLTEQGRGFRIQVDELGIARVLQESGMSPQRVSDLDIIVDVTHSKGPDVAGTYSGQRVGLRRRLTGERIYVNPLDYWYKYIGDNDVVDAVVNGTRQVEEDDFIDIFPEPTLAHNLQRRLTDISELAPDEGYHLPKSLVKNGKVVGEKVMVSKPAAVATLKDVLLTGANLQMNHDFLRLVAQAAVAGESEATLADKLELSEASFYLLTVAIAAWIRQYELPQQWVIALAGGLSGITHLSKSYYQEKMTEAVKVRAEDLQKDNATEQLIRIFPIPPKKYG